MAGTFTLDASVFISAFNPNEAAHEASSRFLQSLQAAGIPLIEPALLLPELAAVVARGQDDSELAIRFARTVARLPHLMLVPLETTLAGLAVEIGARCRLRGADSVYAAVAQRFGSTLVTLDLEQRARAKAAVETASPVDLAG